MVMLLRNNFIIVLILCIAACSDDDDGMVSSGDDDLSSQIDSTNDDSMSVSNDSINLDTTFLGDIAYDIHQSTTFDIWMPASDSPTGLLLYIHGGGFTSGDKNLVRWKGKWDFPTEIEQLLSKSIAFASVNYRLLDNRTEVEGILKPMNDVKRALQYIRSNSVRFNINKNKIVLAGNSAGAGTALWIAVNDDMRDTLDSDPVHHESTRVKAVALRQTQASYNIEDRWMNDVFGEYDIKWDQFLTSNKPILRLYGVSSIKEYNMPHIAEYREKVDMLYLLTSDDPEIWVENTITPVTAPVDNEIANHHAFHAREIKKRADSAGVPNVCYYGRDSITFRDPSNESYIDFIIRKISE